jgi:hypothetical protein
MMTWLESVDYLGLGITFLLLLVLFVWVGGRASPDLDYKDSPRPQNYKEKLARWFPMSPFVMAGSVEKAQNALKTAEKTDKNAREKFKTAIGWDYLFIFIYPLCGAVGCLLVIKFLAAHNLPGTTIGFALIALLPLAALLDVVENYAVLRLLRGPMENPWPQIARWCAIPKFTILGATLFYELFGVLMWIGTRFKG